MKRSVLTPLGKIEYDLQQTQRKSVEIRVMPGGNIRVFAPLRAPLRVSDEFVRSRAEWILQAREQFLRYEQARRAESSLESGQRIPLEGRSLTLNLMEGAPSIEVKGDELLMCAPGDWDVQARREFLTQWCIQRAKERFAGRMAYYQPLIGRGPGKVTVRDQRTKWGSCSNLGNINFNWRLILAPRECLDYVVIHELCHLYEFNHSERFWRRVERYQSDYLIWKKWLKQNGQSLKF